MTVHWWKSANKPSTKCILDLSETISCAQHPLVSKKRLLIKTTTQKRCIESFVYHKRVNFFYTQSFSLMVELTVCELVVCGWVIWVFWSFSELLCMLFQTKVKHKKWTMWMDCADDTGQRAAPTGGTKNINGHGVCGWRHLSGQQVNCVSFVNVYIKYFVIGRCWRKLA